LRDHVDEHLAAAVQRVRTLEVIGYVAAGMDAAEGLVNRGIDDQRHVGHRKGTTEIYAKFDPDYLGKARFAINAWMSDLSRDVPAFARGQPTKQRVLRESPETVRLREFWWAQQGSNL
jgi:hypothetical protein